MQTPCHTPSMPSYEVQTKNFGESEDTILELKRVKDEKLPESNIRQKVHIFLALQQLISQTAKRAIQRQLVFYFPDITRHSTLVSSFTTTRRGVLEMTLGFPFKSISTNKRMNLQCYPAVNYDQLSVILSDKIFHNTPFCFDFAHQHRISML